MAVMDPVPVTMAMLVVVESGLLLSNEPVVVKPTVVLPSVFLWKEGGAATRPVCDCTKGRFCTAPLCT